MKKRSFTLIELLIVLVIIGVLTALILPAYKGYVLRARKAEAVTVTRSIANAVEAYYLETGTFPDMGPVVSGIPSGLNIALPQNPTKYYQYSYTECLQQVGSAPGRPLAAITAYRPESRLEYAFTIFYAYDTPTLYGWAGQKMDSHWYRYYVDEFLLALEVGP